MQLQFENQKVKVIIDQFIKNINKFNDFKKADGYKVINLLPKNLTPDSITWDYFSNLFDKSKETVIKLGICRLYFLFIKNNYYPPELTEIFESYKNKRLFTRELYWAFENKLQPFNLLVIEDQLTENPKKQSVYFKNDCSTLFLSNLLKDFYLLNVKGNNNSSFYTHFQASLGELTINRISDFTPETFHKQFHFYKDTKDSSFSITKLKKFYLFFSETQEGKNILDWRKGIDKNSLQIKSFSRNYENGFIPIPLNSFDPVPESDKWLLMPNGSEVNSTKINKFNYIPVDFSNITDPVLKTGIKHWFWHSNLSLPSRTDALYICIKFANYIFTLRDEHHIRTIVGDSIYDLIVEEIFSYVQFVKLQKFNPSYIVVIRSLLTYLDENSLYKIDPGGFKYLVNTPVNSKNSSKDIPDEDLIKLENLLKQKSHDNYHNTLYYIIFHIAYATEFRISQIINLKVDCLSGLKEEYLSSNSKVSNGKLVKIPITPYTRRYIKTAIKFTNSVRLQCNNDDVREHIFIHNNAVFQYKIVSVRAFSDYLKRCCKELGIEEYTAQNLRDTYMTKAMEYAIKRNLTDLETRTLTIHKRLETTTNHYVVDEIKRYLEATHMTIIGNPVIKGKISEKTNFSTEDLVNDECGYCSPTSCIKKENTLDCLMCSGFIATLDRIPYFEEKISRLDKDIKNASLQSEKDRLSTLKKLYLAYLAELLALKEKTS